jgi:multiple sugar transport system substrate-binding protein
MQDLRQSGIDLGTVRYIEKSSRTFDSELIEALASGTGPDLFLLDQGAIVRHEDRLVAVPYESYSERDFRNTFIEEGELYLTAAGILGIPFSVDPLIMYWNQDILSSEGIAQPPKFWDEFYDLSSELTKRDQSNNIIRSAVAFGEYRNVTNAKEIISALAFQAGTAITMRTEIGIESVLTRGGAGQVLAPAEAALQFFTEFSNPAKTTYSWNRGLPESRQAFAAGDVALYFGFASELPLLLKLNPNLNFDIAELPQSRESGKKVTFGRMSAFAIPKVSRNVSGAFRAALELSSANSVSIFSKVSGLPPVRRDLLSQKQTDAYRSVTYSSALISSAWLEPDDRETDGIFQRMVESVTSGRSKISDAVGNADKELANLLRGR